jgi:polar amino acid transport system substrate-binding protein
VLCLPACDDFRFPRDPDGTLERVLASGRMRVVAVDHVPWVIVEEDGPPTGGEVELIEAFARNLGATIEWRRAPAFKALEALGRRDADLAIGGFTRNAVVAHQTAGHSYAYFAEALVIAAEPGTPLPRDLRGHRVHAAPDLLANGLVEDRGGVPVAERAEAVGLVALPDWLLPARRLVPTNIVLKREEHVIAVPRGENAWIMRLERFLREHAGETAARLRAHAP